MREQIGGIWEEEKARIALVLQVLSIGGLVADDAGLVGLQTNND